MRERCVMLTVACLFLLAAGCESPTASESTTANREKINPGGIHIPSAVFRMEPGTGSVLVSSGIPLPPGALRADGLADLRVYVDSVEQSLYVEPLKGEHADGSLRSVLVQFIAAPRAEQVEAIVVVGQRRGTTDLAKPSNGRSLPAAMLLPTDPAYLVSTELVGKTITRTEAAQSGPIFELYELNFAKYADQHWQLTADGWENNFYDRALAYYAAWSRTANPEYWRRATRLAVNYRRQYLETNNYGSSPHWSQLEGLEAHYLVTGDDSSRTAIGGVARVMTGGFYPHLADMEKAWNEDRIRARVIMSLLLSWKLDVNGDRAAYAARLDTALNKIVATQSPDGAARFVVTCYGSLNYMAGQMNDALMKYYTYYKPDPRIPTYIKRSVDFLWTQWAPTEEKFQYMSVDCPNVGTTSLTADLNNLMVNGFAFTYAHSGDISYLHRADQVFAGGVKYAWLTGSKQFNENYTSSFLYLALRK